MEIAKFVEQLFTWTNFPDNYMKGTHLPSIIANFVTLPTDLEFFMTVFDKKFYVMTVNQ